MTSRTEPMVFLVDDDRSCQRALQRLLNAARLPVKAYRSAEEFLSCPEAHRPGCLLLDMGLPGANGNKIECLCRCASSLAKTIEVVS